ncbi:MAG: hypothetical protein JWR12_3025 [Mucilaginibacter sp.]|nr:hypothetical protein [Mucilaginibacter sp.]
MDETALTLKRVIFASRTGAVMLINDSILNYLQQGEFDKVPVEDIKQLIEIEAIVPAEQNELDFILNQNKISVSKNKVLDIVIQPGASCQLGCHYCGQEHSNHYMSEGVQKKMLDRINHKLASKKMDEIAIIWYGAEPLMAVKQIRELSGPLINIAAFHNISYSASMVTNGLSLKPEIFAEMVEKWKITNFQITIDGLAEFHDKNRYTKQNKPTFSIIFNNILNIVNAPFYKESGAKIMIRCNVDTNNVDGLNLFIQHMADCNLQDKVGFYIIPIHNWGGNNAEQLTGVNKNGFALQEIDWMITLIDLGFEVDILPARTKIVCSAVKEDSEVYDAFGTVSSCWEVPYTPLYKNTNFEIGNLNLPFIENVAKTPMRNWNDDIKKGDTWCAGCNLLPVCGGSCPIHWESGTPACPSFKFNIEDRLVLQYIYAKKYVKRQSVKMIK